MHESWQSRELDLGSETIHSGSYMVHMSQDESCDQTIKNRLNFIQTYILLRGNFFQCHVFAMKSVQNLKSFWRFSQNYFVFSLFSSLYS